MQQPGQRWAAVENCCHLAAGDGEAPEKEMEPGFERSTSDVGTRPGLQQVCFGEEGQGCWLDWGG